MSFTCIIVMIVHVLYMHIEGVEAIYFPLTHAQHRGEVMRSSTSLNQML